MVLLLRVLGSPETPVVSDTTVFPCRTLGQEVTRDAKTESDCVVLKGKVVVTDTRRKDSLSQVRFQPISLGTSRPRPHPDYGRETTINCRTFYMFDRSMSTHERTHTYVCV